MKKKRKERTVVVSADLERLIASHKKANLFELFVLQEFQDTSSSFLPFRIFVAESVHLCATKIIRTRPEI